VTRRTVSDVARQDSTNWRIAMRRGAKWRLRDRIVGLFLPHEPLGGKAPRLYRLLGLPAHRFQAKAQRLLL